MEMMSSWVVLLGGICFLGIIVVLGVGAFLLLAGRSKNFRAHPSDIAELREEVAQLRDEVARLRMDRPRPGSTDIK